MRGLAGARRRATRSTRRCRRARRPCWPSGTRSAQGCRRRPSRPPQVLLGPHVPFLDRTQATLGQHVKQSKTLHRRRGRQCGGGSNGSAGGEGGQEPAGGRGGHLQPRRAQGLQVPAGPGPAGRAAGAGPGGALPAPCPGLQQGTIGELLGENEEFFLEVLDAFTATFDFAGARAWRACTADTLRPSLMRSEITCLHEH